MQFITALVVFLLPAVVVLGMPVEERDFIPPITVTRITIKPTATTQYPRPVVTPTD
ncbi:hypothetical protein C8J56DRAFT_1057739 [Mycena floridula]|nr:hypothetical protein C8J56DRAFT_1057739 [Mycena floridula]